MFSGVLPAYIALLISIAFWINSSRFGYVLRKARPKALLFKSISDSAERFCLDPSLASINDDATLEPRPVPKKFLAPSTLSSSPTAASPPKRMCRRVSSVLSSSVKLNLFAVPRDIDKESFTASAVPVKYIGSISNEDMPASW